MNHVNAVGVQSNAKPHLAESLPSLIEELGNELSILDNHYSNAMGLADRLQGSQPGPGAPSLSAVQSEPEGLLARLRMRLNALSNLNANLGVELGRISSGL